MFWRVGHASNAGMLNFTCACPDLIETGIDDPRSRLSLIFSGRLFHDFAVKGQDHILGICVGGDRDRFAECSNGFRAKLGLDKAGFTWFDRLFGVIGGCATAGRFHGFQNQVGRARVGEGEPVLDRNILLDLAKLEGGLGKGNRCHRWIFDIADVGDWNGIGRTGLGLLRLAGSEQSGRQEQGKEKLFHFHRYKCFLTCHKSKTKFIVVQLLF
jgi:hypothetical protein